MNSCPHPHPKYLTQKLIYRCINNVNLFFCLFVWARCSRQVQRDDAGLWWGVLFVQDVVMAGSVQQEDARVAALWEDVVIYSSSFPSVHVLHQDGHVQGLGQGDDVNVVAFFGHRLHFLNRAEPRPHPVRGVVPHGNMNTASTASVQWTSAKITARVDSGTALAQC